MPLRRPLLPCGGAATSRATSATLLVFRFRFSLLLLRAAAAEDRWVGECKKKQLLVAAAHRRGIKVTHQQQVLRFFMVTSTTHEDQKYTTSQAPRRSGGHLHWPFAEGTCGAQVVARRLHQAAQPKIPFPLLWAARAAFATSAPHSPASPSQPNRYHKIILIRRLTEPRRCGLSSAASRRAATSALIILS